MKLYYSGNLNPRVAVAVARHLKSPLEYIKASPRAPGGAEAFAAINPNALVPVLVEDGKGLWETDAIACRLSMLAGSDFWPGGADLPGLVQWLSWSAHHLTNLGGAFYFENVIKPKYIGAPPDQAVIEGARVDFHRYAKVLDDVLATRRWLIGGRMTYADFRAATIMPFAAEAKMPVEGYKNILAWSARLNEVDAWREPFAGLA